MLRTAGFPLITCPSVACAHLLVTGTLPPAAALAGVALISALIGFLTSTTTLAAGPGPGRPAGLALAGPLAAAQLAGHAVVYLALGEPSTGCLPAMGRGAVAGVRLAILRPDARCAPEHYAAGPLITTTAAMLVSAAAVLLWQLVVAAAGSALLSAAARAWTAVAAMAALAALVLSRRFEALVVTRAPRPAPESVPRPAARRVVTGALLRRGPPAPAVSF